MKVYRNGRSPYFEIDGRRLQECFDTFPKTQGKNRQELSLKLNYTSGYLSRAIRENRVSERAAALIQVAYDIKPSDYVKGWNDKFSTSEAPLRVTDQGRAAASVKTVIQEKVAQAKQATQDVTFKVTVDAGALKKLVREAVLEAFEAL